MSIYLLLRQLIFLLQKEISVNEDEDFIGKISEASNSQKPIKQRDLKSNAKEQKIMQHCSGQNGKLTVMAVLLYLYKKQKGIVNSFISDQVYKDNVLGLLITDYSGDDLDKRLENLFTFIIRKLKSIYETKKDSMKITSYSNFFKSEPIYELILKDFDELDEWDTEKIKDCMVIFEKKKEKFI